MTSENKISTIIFDVDDTLYDVGTGFTAHRNGEIVQQYMVEHLKFPSKEAAKALRDEYFAKYHATAKALTVAQAEGRFPEGAPTFETANLAAYWSEHCDYTLLGPPPTELKAALKQVMDKDHGLTLVAFSNGPRNYVKKVLKSLDLFDLFGEERLYAVDDVLPHCKPEAAAFQKIFSQIGNPSPESCIMVEDSMKNIRQAKALGMKTVLITGQAEDERRILPEDRPETSDPAVDCSLQTIHEFPSVLASLWETPATFAPKPL